MIISLTKRIDFFNNGFLLTKFQGPSKHWERRTGGGYMKDNISETTEKECGFLLG